MSDFSKISEQNDAGSTTFAENFQFNLEYFNETLEGNFACFIQTKKKISDEKPSSLNSMYSFLLDKHEQVYSEAESFTLKLNSLKDKENLKVDYKNTKQLKLEINEISKEIDELEKEHEKRNHEDEILKEALDFYTTNLDFKIEVDTEVDENNYWVKLYFNDKPERTCRFLIDYLNKSVTDFDASSFISPERQDELKQKFKEQGKINSILCTFRNIVLDIDK